MNLHHILQVYILLFMTKDKTKPPLDSLFARAIRIIIKKRPRIEIV